MLNKEMEKALAELTEGNSPTNRLKWAREWKENKGRVVGTLCTYVPEEIIYAAGLLPWRVTGTWRENVPLATAYRPINSCPYCTHVLESVLSGELDFLDGAVVTSRDQDLVRLLDVWKSLKKTSLNVYLYLPHHDSKLACQQFTNEIKRMVSQLEEFTGTIITDAALSEAIAVHNKTRNLMAKVYKLRNKEKPCLSGAEFLGLTTGALVIPKEEFNRRLEKLLPYLEQRVAPVAQYQPRVLVSSDLLDNPAYFSLIEDSGCLIAMDDLDIGSRYFLREAETGSTNPLETLAAYYLFQPGGPHIFSWGKQLERVISLVKDYDIAGVIELVLINSQSRQIRAPYFREKLNAAEIPNISLTVDYHFANAGQLKTRVQAFLEMMES